MKNDKKRNIVIGDIHGCLIEFEELLEKISYNSSNDRLILLGDLVDRGPYSAEVIKKAREMNLESVMGNHEFNLLKKYNNPNYYDKSKKYYEKLSDEDLDYIFHMPPFIKVNNYLIVHGGLRPNINIDLQKKEDLLSLRYLDSNMNTYSLSEFKKIKNNEIKFWTHFWNGPESIIYGHQVHCLGSVLLEKKDQNVFCIGMDSGCCFGGNLSALILETLEIIQVQSKDKYCELRSIA